MSSKRKGRKSANANARGKESESSSAPGDVQRREGGLDQDPDPDQGPGLVEALASEAATGTAMIVELLGMLAWWVSAACCFEVSHSMEGMRV